MKSCSYFSKIMLPNADLKRRLQRKKSGYSVKGLVDKVKDTVANGPISLVYREQHPYREVPVWFLSHPLVGSAFITPRLRSMGIACIFEAAHSSKADTEKQH